MRKARITEIALWKNYGKADFPFPLLWEFLWRRVAGKTSRFPLLDMRLREIGFFIRIGIENFGTGPGEVPDL
jgi:hypothetical protein